MLCQGFGSEAGKMADVVVVDGSSEGGECQGEKRGVGKGN